MRKMDLLSVLVVVYLLLFGLIDRVSPAQREQAFDRQTPVTKVYQDTHKAVVNIAGELLMAASRGPGYLWPDMFDLWGPRFRRRDAVLGSGMVVHEDGYVITNAHVIQGAEKVRVVFSDGREFPAKIISADETKDLAVMTIATDEKLPFIRLGRSNDLMIGETVIAIGNPYGYSNTVTSGVVSAVGRDIQVAEGMWLRGLIQTDAPINPGNSGGPLLNINGELIGVNTAIRAEAENIGFAIPVDTLANNLSQMLMPEKLRRVRLGLAVGRMKKAGQYAGLVVDSVSKASPADEKGIAAGDIILEIDGRKLTKVLDFYIRMIDKQITEPIEIKYLKPGASMRTRSVKLTMKARPLPDGGLLVNDFFQMEVSELNDLVARRFGFDSAYPVLIVTRVEPQGIAYREGLEQGDLILEINDATVRNVKELSLEMEKVSAGDIVEIRIMRIRVGVFGQFQRRDTVRLRARPRKVRRL
ncbi:MAG: trypsin-like peptidase domain-containing protein [Phycisphaerales bacterium]|nr:MAG: trypsin-like peptidase domain-containing protein [Phycisphaerales bacterium]